ncbi:MAG: hypothetical protein LBE04_06565 [Prevotellaceae bacterium]|jgi:hypothetical protein|nr:hypothetical protein [Prevotellaceae bacterium]
MKKILSALIAVIFAILIWPAQIQAQYETVAEKLPHQKKKITIATQPFYSYVNAVRLDVEKRIKDTPAWVQLGVSGHFLADKNNEKNWIIFPGDEISYLRGAGMELNYKYFFNKQESLYFSGGGSYSHYNIKYFDTYWHSYTIDNLVYHTKQRGKIGQKINKLGINAYFGYQIPKPTFLFDIFVGLGYRHSIRSNDKAEPFNDATISLGYTGVVFITGVRFGVKL